MRREVNDELSVRIPYGNCAFIISISPRLLNYAKAWTSVNSSRLETAKDLNEWALNTLFFAYIHVFTRSVISPNDAD